MLNDVSYFLSPTNSLQNSDPSYKDKKNLEWILTDKMSYL